MKKVIAILLTVVLMMSAVSVFAFAAHPTSGTANSKNTATWTLDAAGTVTFKGTGAAYFEGVTGDALKELKTKIKKAVFGEGIETVGSYLFEDCTSLKTVVFSSTIATIGSSAFSGCTALTGATLPSALEYIYGSAFEDCKFAKLTVPATVINIGNGAFANSNLTVTIASGSKYYKNVGNIIYSKDNKDLVYYPAFRQDAEYIIPTGVEDISYAFINNTYLKKVTVASTVVDADMAFTGCTALKTINFSEGMKAIPDYICYKATALENMTIPSTVEEIGAWAFEYSGLKSVIIPEGVKVLDYGAFIHCQNLVDIKLPSTITYVDSLLVSDTPFYKNEANWTSGILYIGNCVVDVKTGTKGNITLKNGTKTIGVEAFIGSKITSITIPDSVKYVCNAAFYGVSTLATINSTGNFISVGARAFEGTAFESNPANWYNGGLYIGKTLIKASDAIEALTIKPGTVAVADKAAYEREKFVYVDIPASVKYIGNYSFAYNKLTTIKLNKGIEYIGDYAFSMLSSYNAGVKNLVIPEGVKYIGESAFSGMALTEYVTMPKSLEKIGDAYIWPSLNLKQVTFNGTYAQCVKLGLADRIDLQSIYVKFVFVGGYGNVIPSFAMQDTAKIFTDVKTGKWYKNAIDYTYNYGFIKGTTATKFDINASITRGMFITIIARIAGVNTSTAANKAAPKVFSDVATGKYYSAAIVWAKQNNIASGTSATTFAPNAAIARQELCVMISNFAKYMKITLTPTESAVTFADDAKIAKWAKAAVTACQQADIVNGYNEKGVTEFRPKNTATRAEAAQILYKFHKDYVVK